MTASRSGAGSSQRWQRCDCKALGVRRRMVTEQPTSTTPAPHRLFLLLLLHVVCTATTNLVSALADGIAPTLPLSEINVVIVTDVHSWVGGHALPPVDKNSNEQTRTADYGDVLSFVEHLKNYIYYSPGSDSVERDVWFVMNGDWIDGTGLAMNGDAQHLVPILEKMNFDAVTVGNHELYRNSIIAQMTQPAGFVEFLGHRYVSSNVMRADRPDRSIGNLYTILRGRHANLLVFGFLFEMTDADDLVTVDTVATTVQAAWFKAVVKNTAEYHAILVLAHMDVHDPLLQIILTAIRTLVGPDMPIQFVTGHTHYRGVNVLDEYSTSVEAGRYLDTVGFVSFPRIEARTRERLMRNIADEAVDLSANTTSVPTSATFFSDKAGSVPANVTAATAGPAPADVVVAPSKFQHVFLDATPAAFKTALGMAAEFELKTLNGEDLTRFIRQIQSDLGLNTVVGWTCERYFLNRSIASPDSLWGLFQRQVVPAQATARNQAVLLESGSWRYDVLYEGDVRLDDVIGISPFNSSFVVLNNVEMQALLEFNVENTFMKVLPNYVLSFADPDTMFDKVDVYVDSFEAKSILEALQNFSSVPIDPPSVTNVTTTSIWLDYFATEGYSYCKTQGKAPPKSHFEKKKNPIGESQGAEDLFQATFGAVAIATVLVLCAAMVRQQGALSRQESTAKELIVLQAQQEYDESYHDGEDRSEDEEYGTEGELL